MVTGRRLHLKELKLFAEPPTPPNHNHNLETERIVHFLRCRRKLNDDVII